MVHADGGTRTSLGGNGAPNPPPVPPNLVEAMVALVNATAENARLLREMAQHNQNVPQDNRGRHNNRNETTYVDFTDTRPLVFTRVNEPLEVDDWLRIMEQKFDLIDCIEYQKPVFAAQQLRGAAGAWWGNHLVAQPAGHRVTWAEFHEVFHAHFIPEDIMLRKLEEFLALKQGDQ
jgi:hypothetical protein